MRFGASCSRREPMCERRTGSRRKRKYHGATDSTGTAMNEACAFCYTIPKPKMYGRLVLDVPGELGSEFLQSCLVVLLRGFRKVTRIVVGHVHIGEKRRRGVPVQRIPHGVSNRAAANAGSRRADRAHGAQCVHEPRRIPEGPPKRVFEILRHLSTCIAGRDQGYATLTEPSGVGFGNVIVRGRHRRKQE